MSVVNQVLRSCNVDVKHNKTSSLCDACALGKSHKLPFVTINTKYSTPLELVFAYLWGFAPCFFGGYQYYVPFVDAYFRNIWVYFLQRKYDIMNVRSLVRSVA